MNIHVGRDGNINKKLVLKNFKAKLARTHCMNNQIWLSCSDESPSGIADLSQYWLSCSDESPSGIADLSQYWLSCSDESPSGI